MLQILRKHVFFCDKPNELISCRSTSLHEHVKIWATHLSNPRLLAKLSEGDMIATAAQYHKRCLTSIFNLYRCKTRAGQSEAETLRTIERNASSDVVKYIKDQVMSCLEIDGTPIFTQKVLTNMYNVQLIHHGADEEFTKRTYYCYS